MLRSMFATTALVGAMAFGTQAGVVAAAWAQTVLPDDEIGRALDPVVTPERLRNLNHSKVIPGVPAPAPGEARRPAAQAMIQPAPATVPVDAVCRPGDQPGTVDCPIQFATGSARLPPAERYKLDQIGRVITKPPRLSYHFLIEGHTDTTGSAAFNKILSQRRAEAVTYYLISQCGIAADRLQPVGVGEERLLINTGPQTPEPRNRSVVVLHIGS